MQKYLYLILISFSLTSCYTYQRKKQVVKPLENGQESAKKTVNGTTASAKDATADVKSKKAQQTVNEQIPVPINVQNELQPTKNYKIKVDGRAYKVIVDKWEGDSLVAHPISKPEKILKFHKNQINAETIAEKRFSKPLSDILTVVTYAGIGVGVWMLLR
ncbi:hypothetical protein AR438_11845 [Chryseobacterium aquaticum]|uniref:Lipoprotein n=1 Tax=Chryseobacterium aquaticum TaxID=452084 RepID=A0A0Q3HRN1_9FLAO|nr:hypothetical protein [Chryseobacterium aquaticum]KQK25213.1 hypothetical protein AR438_11845 [Chryseobacterium aquaticum]